MGLTVIDTGVLIGSLNPEDAHHHTAYQAINQARARLDRIAIPASAYSEFLVHPFRSGQDAVDIALAFMSEAPIVVVPLEERIAEAAARLRARHGSRLQLPHALVVATAQVLDADVLVTTDRGWPRRSSLGLRTQIVTL